MMTEPNPALYAVRQALRTRVPYAPEVAAAVLVASLTQNQDPERRRRVRRKGTAAVSRSTKRATLLAPRNAFLKWSRLFTEGASAALLVAQLPLEPAYLGLAGVVIVGQLRSLVTIELSERHGAVIYVLWRRGGTTTSQRLEMIRPEVNRELRKLGKRSMTVRELRDTLQKLSELGCVSPTLLGWLLKDKVWLTV